ncbi:MAG: VCBS repeat-containing protein [Planctomycetota bacterium]
MTKDNQYTKIATKTATRSVLTTSLLLAIALLMNPSHAEGQASYQAKTPVGIGATPTATAKLDLDADGDLDLAICFSSINRVEYFFNDGTGTFTPNGFGIVGSGPTDIVAADISGDGLDDLVVCCNLSAQIYVLVNTGTGSFQAPVIVSGGTDPFRIIPGDADGDGDIDIVVCNISIGATSLLANIGGTLAFAGSIFGIPGCSDGAYGDLDGDGDDDLVLTASGASAVLLFENTGTALVPGNFIATGAAPFSLVLADLDNDGTIDIATCNVGSSDISVLRNTGSFNFNRQDYPTDVTPVDIVATNVDNTLGTDLAVVTFDAFNLRVLTNNGQGAFSDQIVSFVGANPFHVTSGDFTGDCHDDLACLSFSGSVLSVFTNNLPAAPYPGTGDDLAIGTGLNTPPVIPQAAHIYKPQIGEIVETRMISPMGTFNGIQALLVFQLFFPGFSPPGALPGLHLNQFGSGPLVILNLPLAAAGNPFFFTTPASIGGMRFMSQALVFTPIANNGSYAASNGHEVRFDF